MTGQTERELALVVADRLAAAEGVVELHLAHADGDPLPTWEPGAHLEVLLDNGVVRHYSLTGLEVDERIWKLAVLLVKDGKGGSRHVHDTLQPGAVVRVRGPRNHFALTPAGRYLFLAGGIGITPILPMIRAVVRTGAPWTLHYGGRSRSSMAFLADLEQFGTNVQVVAEDETGILDLARIWREAPADSHVYACGPEAFLTAVEAAQAASPLGSLTLERFSATVVPDDQNGTFEVVAERSGVTVRVPPEQSILSSLRAAGLEIESSCEEGVCGTCESKVISGQIDHRDLVLSDAEKEDGDTMMICVSRCLGDRLVLDR